MPGFNIGGTGGGPPNTIETSRKHRYLLRVLQPLTRDILIVANKIQPPQAEIDRVTIHHKQDEIYTPGKQRWSPAEITFYRRHASFDSGTCDEAARQLYEWWATSMLILQESKIARNDAGGPYKRDVILEVLDGTGQVSWVYNMYGVWPSKMSPDSFDASDNSIANIVATLQVDKVKEECGPTALGRAMEIPCEEQLEFQAIIAAP